MPATIEKMIEAMERHIDADGRLKIHAGMADAIEALAANVTDEMVTIILKSVAYLDCEPEPARKAIAKSIRAALEE